MGWGRGAVTSELHYRDVGSSPDEPEPPKPGDQVLAEIVSGGTYDTDAKSQDQMRREADAHGHVVLDREKAKRQPSLSRDDPRPHPSRIEVLDEGRMPIVRMAGWLMRSCRRRMASWRARQRQPSTTPSNLL